LDEGKARTLTQPDNSLLPGMGKAMVGKKVVDQGWKENQRVWMGKSPEARMGGGRGKEMPVEERKELLAPRAKTGQARSLQVR